MKIEISRLLKNAQFDSYYDFRWRMLRKPLGQEKGAEKDELEDESYHAMIIKNKVIIGVGRIHFIVKNSIKKAQIRYMAIDKKYQRKGYGSKLLQRLEKVSLDNNVSYVFLHAREEALNFYFKNNYIKDRKSHVLLGSIQHWLMHKKI
tara:strand:+ start:145 stop:588 length:444 start_codon:yes stop_codon:yes gene_type:complete